MPFRVDIVKLYGYPILRDNVAS